MKRKAYKLTYIAIFSAVLCIISPFSLPFGPMPITLATFVLYVIAYLSDTFSAFMSLAIYIALGIVGLPVFSGFSGGIGHILSYTGGFILGYIPMVLIIAPFSKRGRIPYLISMICGTVVLYVVGCAWYSHYTDTGIFASVLACVIPFLIGDTVKISVAFLLSRKINRKKISQ